MTTIELPTGRIDDDGNIFSDVTKLIKACGIKLHVSSMIDLTEEAYSGLWSGSNDPGICPMPGACSENVKIMMTEKKVQKSELQKMRCLFWSNQKSA